MDLSISRRTSGPKPNMPGGMRRESVRHAARSACQPATCCGKQKAARPANPHDKIDTRLIGLYQE